MNVYRQKTNISYTSFFLFFLSPIISLPVVLFEIYKRRKGALFVFSMIMGVITYLLLPDWSLDLARYYVKFEEFSSMNTATFLSFLQDSSDYLYYIILFVFSQTGLPFQVLLFLLTTFNYYVVFYIFDKIANRFSLPSRKYFLFFIYLNLSIGLLYYLSATRFVLATSFFLLFIYYQYFANRKFLSYFFLLVSVFMHVATFLYVPLTLFIPFVRNKKLLIFFTVFLGILTIFLPLSFFQQIASLLPGFAQKMNIYMEIVEEANWANALSHKAIILVALVFLLQQYKRLDINDLNLFLLTLLPVLITLPFGFLVYDRYIMIFKLLFVVILFKSYLSDRSYKLNNIAFLTQRFLLLIPFLLYDVYSVYYYRANLEPILNIDNFFLVSIFSKTYTVSDFFYK